MGHMKGVDLLVVVSREVNGQDHLGVLLQTYAY